MSRVIGHSRFPYFFKVLSNPAWLVPWECKVIRQGLPRWMSRPYRFTGLGSAFAGGRWNVKGLMPAVYASTEPATLNAEVHYKGLRYGWTPQDFHGQLMVGMRWRLQAVVDLTAPATLHTLHVTRREILDADWEAEQAEGLEAVPQAIARAAFENLAEGLVVPSARRPGGVNIVYYPSHRRDGTLIQTLNPARLPPDMHGLDS